MDISRKVEEGLRKYAPDVEITFERLAVNPDQIKSWNLTTRPTKKTDTRSKNFEGESVEIEAVPASTLRRLCREAIETHLPDGWMDDMEAVEEAERGTLFIYADEATTENDSDEDE